MGFGGDVGGVGASARAASAARSFRIFLHAFRWPRSRQSILWHSVEQYCVVPQGQLSLAFSEQMEQVRRSFNAFARAFFTSYYSCFFCHSFGSPGLSIFSSRVVRDGVAVGQLCGHAGGRRRAWRQRRAGAQQIIAEIFATAQSGGTPDALAARARPVTPVFDSSATCATLAEIQYSSLSTQHKPPPR